MAAIDSEMNIFDRKKYTAMHACHLIKRQNGKDKVNVKYLV